MRSLHSIVLIWSKRFIKATSFHYRFILLLERQSQQTSYMKVIKKCSSMCEFIEVCWSTPTRANQYASTAILGDFRGISNFICFNLCLHRHFKLIGPIFFYNLKLTIFALRGTTRDVQIYIPRRYSTICIQLTRPLMWAIHD